MAVEEKTSVIEGHQKNIDRIVKESEEQKRRANFKYVVGKTPDVELKDVHGLVSRNRTREYGCVYAIEDGSYVLFIKPR